MMNPYAAPKDASDDHQRLTPLGRSDCPKCATTQPRYVFINPWYRCRTCGSPLRLRLSAAVSLIILLGTAALYLALLRFHFFWSAVRSYPLMFGYFFWFFFYEATKLAIGRPSVNLAELQPPESQSSVSVRLLLQISASLFLCIATVLVCIFIGTALPIVVAIVCCTVILMASMILLGSPGAQGHLVFPSSLR